MQSECREMDGLANIVIKKMFFFPDAMSNVLLWHDKASGIFEGYRMVFARISEHTSSGYIFASTSSDLFCHASSEHMRQYRLRPLAGISLLLKSYFAQSNQAYTSKKGQ